MQNLHNAVTSNISLYCFLWVLPAPKTDMQISWIDGERIDDVGTCDVREVMLQFDREEWEVIDQILGEFISGLALKGSQEFEHSVDFALHVLHPQNQLLDKSFQLRDALCDSAVAALKWQVWGLAFHRCPTGRAILCSDKFLLVLQFFLTTVSLSPWIIREVHPSVQRNSSSYYPKRARAPPGDRGDG